MIRYKNLDEAERNNKAAFRQKLHQSFPRFVAYCGIGQGGDKLYHMNAGGLSGEAE